MNLFRATLVFLSLLVTVSPAWSRPYNGDIFTFFQPDGGEIDIRLYGDEFYAVVETLDGYTLTKDEDTGYYCYAQLSDSGDVFVSTGIPATTGFVPPLRQKKHLRISPRGVAAKRQIFQKKFGVDDKGRLLPRRAMLFHPQDYGIPRWSSDYQHRLETQPDIAFDGDPAPPGQETTGLRIGLVLLARFPDRTADVTISRAEVDAYVNAPDYTDFDNATSVHGYFALQSSGKLHYNCTVTAYFTAAHDRSYYTDPSISYGTRAKELINEGLTVLKSGGFDFTHLDGNRDQVIDGINLFYAGNRVNNWSEGLWPHKWGSSWSGLIDTGMSPSFQYQITNMGSSLSLGTFCHENGHMICRFPDLYSYNGNAARIRNYSLMSSSRKKHPVNIDAYLKMKAGWANITDIYSTSHVRGALGVDQNSIYRYRNPNNPKEYFLLSLRTDSGYEGNYNGTRNVNPTDGLVVYHVFENGSNTHSTIFTNDNPTADYTTPFELLVIEANPASGLTPWYDDPTPGNNDGFHADDKNMLNDATTPALQFWNGSSGRTTPSGLRLHSIGARGDQITFIVGEGAVTGPGEIGVTRSSLSVKCDVNSDAPSEQITLFNSGGGTLNYVLSADEDWLSLTPSTGSLSTLSETFAVSFDSSSLIPGIHQATILAVSSGATNSPLSIPVTLEVNDPPLLELSTTLIEITLKTGEKQTVPFTIRNTGGGTLNYSLSETVNWLSLSTQGGSVNAEEDEVEIHIDSTVIALGEHSATIVVTSDHDAVPPQQIEITLRVADKPLLGSSPQNIQLQTVVGTPSLDYSFTLKNDGVDTMDFTLSESVDWLSISPESGSTSSETTIHLLFTPGSLPLGEHNTELTISSTTAENSPIYLPVSLKVASPGEIQLDSDSYTTAVTQGEVAIDYLTLTNGGQSTYSYSITSDVGWLTVIPSSGSINDEPKEIRMIVDARNLMPGTHHASLTVTSPEAINSPKTVPVEVGVSETVLLDVSPRVLHLETETGSSPQSLTLTLQTSPSGPFTYLLSDDADWLHITPAAGTSDENHEIVTVSFTTEDLPENSYSATITAMVEGAANAPLAVPVELTVAQSRFLTFDKNRLVFSLTEETSASTTVNLKNGDNSSHRFTLSSSSSWLTIHPRSGVIAPGLLPIVVTVHKGLLGPGGHRGTIFIQTDSTPEKEHGINVELSLKFKQFPWKLLAPALSGRPLLKNIE